MIVDPKAARHSNLKLVQNAQRLMERDVKDQLVGFMESKGWRPIRMQTGMMQNGRAAIPFGEKGQCDWQFIRYLPGFLGRVGLIWVETKRPGAKPACRCRIFDKKRCTACSQKAWKETEIQRGGLVVTLGEPPPNPKLIAAGEIFTKDIREYDAWYSSTFAWLHDGRFPGQIDLFGGLVG